MYDKDYDSKKYAVQSLAVFKGNRFAFHFIELSASDINLQFSVSLGC